MRNAYATPSGDRLVGLIIHLESVAASLTAREKRFLRRFIPPWVKDKFYGIILIPENTYLSKMPESCALKGMSFIYSRDIDLSDFVEVSHEEIDAIFGTELTQEERPEDWV